MTPKPCPICGKPLSVIYDHALCIPEEWREEWREKGRQMARDAEERFRKLLTPNTDPDRINTP